MSCYRRTPYSCSHIISTRTKPANIIAVAGTQHSTHLVRHRTHTNWFICVSPWRRGSRAGRERIRALASFWTFGGNRNANVATSWLQSLIGLRRLEAVGIECNSDYLDMNDCRVTAMSLSHWSCHPMRGDERIIHSTPSMSHTKESVNVKKCATIFELFGLNHPMISCKLPTSRTLYSNSNRALRDWEWLF